MKYNFEADEPITQDALKENGWYLNEYIKILTVYGSKPSDQPEGGVDVAFYKNNSGYEVYVYDDDGDAFTFRNVKTMGQLYDLMEMI